MVVQVSAATAGALSMSLGVIADLITINQYLFSTIEPEVSKIYDYTYDTRQNLIRLMDAVEGADYMEELPGEMKERAQKSIEKINEGLRFLEESDYVENLAKNIGLHHEAKIDIIRQIMDFFTKEQANKAKELHEEYPFTYPLWPGAKKEDGQGIEETGLTSADIGELVASIKQLGEKVDLVNSSLGASEVIEASLAAKEDGSNILNRLLAMNEKFNAFAGQNVEVQAEAIAVKIVEKTGGTVSLEEKVTKEQVAEMISGETEKLPEQHQEMLKLLERNQSIMYSYKDQLLRLENMIQTKALSFDQIYRYVCRRAWEDYKCGG